MIHLPHDCNELRHVTNQALDIYDFHHIFGGALITFDKWNLRFGKPEFGRTTNQRRWERIKKELLTSPYAPMIHQEKRPAQESRGNRFRRGRGVLAANFTYGICVPGSAWVLANRTLDRIKIHKEERSMWAAKHTARRQRIRGLRLRAERNFSRGL